MGGRRRSVSGGLIVAVLAVAAPVGSALAQAAPRSAQSDCTREAERRGYRVLSTGSFQQLRDGWQLDIKTRDHAGRNVNGTCFVETRTGDVTLYGFGWGGGTPVDRFQFTCASPDNKHRECQLPVDGEARLVKQKSDSPCVEGRSWGQRGDRIWVDRGCRGRFEVVRGGGGGGSGQSVECRSKNDLYRECAIQRGHVGRLVKDYTGRCRENSTWGNRDGVIWVTSGCQGSFEVRPSSGAGASGGVNAGQPQRAEMQCRNEATRQGVTVRQIAPAQWRGSYWETTVAGTLRGQSVRAGCRFHPTQNRAELRF